nr:hypothetical protein [Tanacetum cinerariifolium]
MDTELPSTKDIQPPLVQVEIQKYKPIEEPSVVIPKAKANLPYLSRLQKEKPREKDDILAAKFMEIFRDLHFELSFADALDKLIKLTKTPLNKNCSAVVLKKLPEKLGRPFLSTDHVIINVYEREIIIRQDQQSLIIQCGDIPSIKKVEQINKIDFIDAGGIDFESEEIENFLNGDSISFGVKDSSFNNEEDILFLKSLLREDPIPSHLIIPNQTKLPIEEPNNSFTMEYEHFNTNLSDYLDEFYGPFIPIHILKEERIRREHADYINRMEMLFTINPCPHNLTNDNTNVKSFSSFPIPIQEEIDVIFVTNDVLPPSDVDSDEEVEAVDVLRVDNFIQNSEHEYSKSEDSDFDNPLLPLPPPEPPDKGFDVEIKISVERNVIVKFECINVRVKFDVFNDEIDVLFYFMFVIFAKEFFYSPPRVRIRSLIL